jgi:S-adenosylmethionine synthetase
LTSLIVSERIKDVRKDHEVKLTSCHPLIDEVYANVSEKIGTDVTQIRKYVDDRFRAVSGYVAG